MTRSRIAPGVQFALLYALAAVWHCIWIAAFLSGKGGLSNLGLIWIVLFFFAPLLWLYALVRVAVSEELFIERHPFVFFGSVAVAIFPPIIAVLL
jgi:hypothetical protein